MTSFAIDSCPNSYIRKSPSNRMESQIYLIKVPLGFSPESANVLATYKSISSQRNPSHQCIFTEWDRINSAYKQGVCKNLMSGRSTSIYGGSGYRIREDGSSWIEKSCYRKGSGCAFIEDSNGNRLAITSDIATDLRYHWDGSWRLIKECSSGSIEAIKLMRVFPGYAILIRSVETGFVNTYQTVPNVQF